MLSRSVDGIYKYGPLATEGVMYLLSAKAKTCHRFTALSPLS